MIEIHSYPTPNGVKIMILLEELQVPWRHVDVNIRLGEQFTANHIALSPNNKIPAMLDPNGPGGQPLALMESNAILWYLAEKHGAFLPLDAAARYDCLQWMLFQSSHVGPMIGQANHFNNHSDVQYGKDRYNHEVRRIYRVIDTRLASSEWMAGGGYGLADIALHPWCRNRQHVQIDESSHPHFMRWFDAVDARAAVERANAQAQEIRARMDRASDSGETIDLYNTRDNLERLSRAVSAT